MTKAIPGVAIFVAKPGHEAEVERLLKTLVTPSRGEAGATYYNLHRDREICAASSSPRSGKARRHWTHISPPSMSRKSSRSCRICSKPRRYWN